MGGAINWGGHSLLWISHRLGLVRAAGTDGTNPWVSKGAKVLVSGVYRYFAPASTLRARGTFPGHPAAR